MGGARNIPRSAKSAYNRKLSDYERLRWLLIKSRFPGFTEEVERAFWYIIGELGLEPKDSEFAEEFLKLIPVPLDILDRTNKTQHTSLTSDRTLVSEWLKNIYECHCLFDDSVSHYESPLGVIYEGTEAASALADAKDTIAKLKEENINLNDKIRKIELEISSLHPRRVGTIYKLILLMVKKHYSSKTMNQLAVSISESISNEEGKSEINEDTIKSILDDARSHFKKI